MKYIFYFLLIFPLMRQSAEKGKIGIGVDVSVEGFIFPKLQKVKVKYVEQGSPAADKYVKVGDLIVSIDGCAISERPARKAEKSMSKGVGEAVLLELINSSGKKYGVTLIAR